MFSGDYLNILSIEGVRFVGCVRPLDFSSCFWNFFLLSGLLLVFCIVISMDYFCYLSWLELVVVIGGRLHLQIFAM